MREELHPTAYARALSKALTDLDKAERELTSRRSHTNPDLEGLADAALPELRAEVERVQAGGRVLEDLDPKAIWLMRAWIAWTCRLSSSDQLPHAPRRCRSRIVCRKTTSNLTFRSEASGSDPGHTPGSTRSPWSTRSPRLTLLVCVLSSRQTSGKRHAMKRRRTGEVHERPGGFAVRVDRFLRDEEPLTDLFGAEVRVRSGEYAGAAFNDCEPLVSVAGSVLAQDHRPKESSDR
jgi:hypothetical protein